jgi:hypothetical protein
VTEEVGGHETSVGMVRPSPSQVDAGANVALRVQVSCPEACDLRGGIVRIVGQDGALAGQVELTEFDGAANLTDEFVVTAPMEPGEYAWMAVFPALEKEGISHREASTPVVFIVKPHSTSIAVWDIPSPIPFNDRFKIKVGVKCSAECNLVDKEIRVYGQRGKKVATGVLGGVPWAGTSGLYWAEVELEAPGVQGYYKWRVRFPKPGLQLPHEGASYQFGFTTARPPEHVVTVEVIGHDTKTPIGYARVVLSPPSGPSYAAYTDGGGVAKLKVPSGEYDLFISKTGHYSRVGAFKSFETTVEVADDAAVKAELYCARRPLDM